MRHSIAVLTALLLLSGAVLAQPPRPTHDITIDDYFTVDVITQQQIAPNGQHIAYTVARWDKAGDRRRVDLWVVHCENKKTRRLTFEHSGLSLPRWSKDSKTVYFLGRQKRESEKQPPLDGTQQIWRVSITGGEPFAITRVPGGVESFDLIPDPEAVVYQTSAARVEGEWKHLKEKLKDVEYGHGAGKKSQLWRLDLETWRTEKVVDEGRVIREFKVSPDGLSMAMITTPDETVVSFEGESRVDVFDLGTKKSSTLPDRCYRQEGPSPYGWLETLAWSPDGRHLASNVIFDAYPAMIVVGQLKDGRWSSRPLERQHHVRGYGSPLAWDGDNQLCWLAEEKGRVRLCRTFTDEKDRSITFMGGDVVVESLSVAGAEGKHRLAFVMNTTGHTPELFWMGKEVRPEPATMLNPQVARWKLPRISTFAWKSSDGTPVEGILELPPDYKEGQKIPLVVCIHGGPTTADRLHLQFWIYGRTLLPAKGYAVLCPNYRGSVGYGDKFVTDLIGHANDRDVADILSGVDALVEKGVADRDRLGVMGWSNGGYLTNCVISKTTRFKAASSGAGIVDTVMQWGANDEPAYMMAFLRGLPWERPELYRKSSSTYDLGKIRTPTLIHVGANDERCPPGQSRMLHRALKEYVKVPTELLVYPGEPHGLMKYSSRRAKMEWDLAWFDRHILGKMTK